MGNKQSSKKNKSQLDLPKEKPNKNKRVRKLWFSKKNKIRFGSEVNSNQSASDILERLDYSCDAKSNLSENYNLEDGSSFFRNILKTEANDEQIDPLFGSQIQIDIDEYKE